MTLVYGTLHVMTGTPLPVSAALGALPTCIALYFPATFSLEEVTFRGALDAHVHHDGETRGWRRSRNLAAPAFAHAVNDAVRNAVMLGL